MLLHHLLISEMKKSGLNALAISVDSLNKNPGRVIAPIAAPETEKISMRNNMPDWKREDDGWGTGYFIFKSIFNEISEGVSNQ